MSRKVGQNQGLLQKVSTAVRVHGYTANILTTEKTVEDGTRGGGKHIVCVGSKCINSDQSLPARKPSPAEIIGAEAARRRFEETHGRFEAACGSGAVPSFVLLLEGVGQQARRRAVESVHLHVFPALCVVLGGIPRTLDRRLSLVRVPLDQIVERQFHSLHLGATR
jgi:hypothetical protein